VRPSVCPSSRRCLGLVTIRFPIGQTSLSLYLPISPDIELLGAVYCLLERLVASQLIEYIIMSSACLLPAAGTQTVLLVLPALL